jgi:hypothetical protein
MNNPKEKADELVKKFIAPTKVYHEHLGWVNYLDSAKECALIAVDEILDSVIIIDLTTAENQFKYWQEVQNEINKL